MEIKENTLTPELFLELYTSVGWEPPTLGQVTKALKNTLATFTAYENGCAIGVARLIGDGGMSFYIKDFAVIPSMQAHGAGSLLLQAMEQYIRQSIREDWAVSLELISTKEAVKFYKKHGFEERPCDWDGPGMFRMIRNKTIRHFNRGGHQYVHDLRQDRDDPKRRQPLFCQGTANRICGDRG